MQRDATSWLDLGRQQFQNGNYHEALRYFDQALALDPNLSDAWSGRGAALKNLNRLQEALTAYDTAIQHDPNSYKTWYNRGLLLEEQLNRLPEAITCYQTALTLSPTFPQARDKLNALQTKNPTTTPPNSQQPLSTNPKTPETYPGTLSADTDAEVWFQRGNQQAMAGDFVGAIASYDKAIEIKPDLHKAWYLRGCLLYALGQHEAAIASYDKAVEIKPDDHKAWSNRGNALSALGQHEAAIANYDKALALNPKNDQAWSNRGSALNNLGRYKEAIEFAEQSLEIAPENNAHAWCVKGYALSGLKQYAAAIESYDKAVQIKPDFHQMWFHQGDALSALEKLEAAIASYDQAVAIKPDYLSAWLNRGVALDDLGRYDEAIASYSKVLEINPDDYQAWNNRGNALSGLRQYEAAIASFDKALTIKIDLWLAWRGRGKAAGNSALPEVSILPFPALNQRGYVGQLASYEEGLNHVQRETQPEGWGELHRAIGRAHYYWGRFEAHPTFYYQKAIKNYRTALETLTAEDFPEAHLGVLQDWRRAALGLSDLETAKRLQVQGLEVFRDLLNAQPSSRQKRQLEVKFSGFSQLGVDVLVQAGEPVAALEAAERYKNRALTWILEEWREQVVSASYGQMQAGLNATTAAVYWHLSPDALTTFVLRHDAPVPILLDAITHPVETNGHSSSPPSWQQLKELETWMKDWNRDYQAYREKGKEQQSDKQNHPWRQQLPQRLEQLKAILNVAAIETALGAKHSDDGLEIISDNPLPNASPITHVILIPHRDLHQLPLHALFDQQFTITYLPSMQVGLSDKSHQEHSHFPIDQAGDSLLSIENPLDALAFAELESAVISHLFYNRTRLQGNRVTQSNIEAAVQTQHTIFHFTGHGAYNVRQPQHSALQLAEPGTLTAETISKLDLSAYKLVCLAACETAITGNQTIEAEYVGLVSAFLKAGAACVVSTLWTVEERSNAWMMIRFYQLLLAGHTPAIAFKHAQTWLRTVTYAELVPWLQDLSRGDRLESGAREYLEYLAKGFAQDSTKMDSSVPPFQHPYYWAAFTITGATAV